MRKSKTRDEFLQLFKEKYGEKYDYSLIPCDKKIKWNDRIYVICRKHDKTFNTTPMLHLNGFGCQECKDEYEKDLFVNEARKTWGDYYSYEKSDYKDMRTPVVISCPQHGEFIEAPQNHIKGKGCPVCGDYILALHTKKPSSSEILAMRFFLDNGIKYIYQWRITNEHPLCANSKMFIDFYLPDLNVAIELNGIQHYKPIKLWGGQQQFQKQQERDNSVREYCKDKNISLVEISEVEEDVVEVLSKVINVKSK